MKILDIITESRNKCPHCGGPLVSESELMEKKDACYYKIKSSAKVWPSAYASGRLVQCRKKGAANYGNKSEGVAEGYQLDELAIGGSGDSGDYLKTLASAWYTMDFELLAHIARQGGNPLKNRMDVQETIENMLVVFTALMVKLENTTSDTLLLSTA